MPIKARNTAFTFSVVAIIADAGAAGADLTGQTVWRAPFDCEITKLTMSPLEVFAGLDGSNSLVLDVKRNNTGTAIGSETYTTNLVAGSENEITPLDDVTKLLAKDDELTVTQTNGATANPGLMVLLIEYKARASAHA